MVRRTQTVTLLTVKSRRLALGAEGIWHVEIGPASGAIAVQGDVMLCFREHHNHLPAEWLALSNLSHNHFGPIDRIVHGINCRWTAELCSAVRYFTQSNWAAKRMHPEIVC